MSACTSCGEARATQDGRCFACAADAAEALLDGLRQAGRGSYGSSPTRLRRTKREIERIREAILDFAYLENPVTVRQTYYHLVTLGLIAKTEGEYNRTVVRLMSEMRREGLLPYRWVADNTRWMRKPTTYGSADDFLKETARLYRRDLWRDAETHVEIWLEKEALAGVLVEVTDEWDVPLMVTRGYASLSFLHSAANLIEASDRFVALYHFGDFDPSGRDIDRAIVAGIEECGPIADIDFSFERIAVTRAQIAAWNLPTRPTKKGDTRARKHRGESVEVDAIPPSQLRDLCRGVIERHVDAERWAVLQKVEDEERRGLERLAERGINGGSS
jgi:hypothetical protein